MEFPDTPNLIPLVAPVWTEPFRLFLPSKHSWSVYSDSSWQAVKPTQAFWVQPLRSLWDLRWHGENRAVAARTVDAHTGKFLSKLQQTLEPSPRAPRMPRLHECSDGWQPGP